MSDEMSNADRRKKKSLPDITSRADSEKLTSGAEFVIISIYFQSF